MVKRYRFSEVEVESGYGSYMEEDCSGGYVEYDDYSALLAESERLKSQAGYTAADVATAAADGFRDGVRSVDLERLVSIRNRLHEMACHVGEEWEDSAYEMMGDVQSMIDAHKGE